MNTRPTNLYEQFQPPERLTLLLEAMARDDEAEAGRLRRSCPRAGYTGPEADFLDRCSMAFDILAVVTIDLRCAWAKLHVMRCVLGGIRDMATAHRITATLAFIDGERCGRGLPQCEFFANPLPEPEAESQGDGERPGGDDDLDEGVHDDSDADDEEVIDPSPGQIDRGRRMDAVERRVGHFTTSTVVEMLLVMEDVARDLVNTWAAFTAFCHGRLGVGPETMLRAWQFPLGEFEETLKRYEKTKPDPKKVTEYFGYITKQWDRRFRPKPPGHEYLICRYPDAEDDGTDGGDGE